MYLLKGVLNGEIGNTILGNDRYNSKIGAAGYGAYKSLVDNDTTENRTKNIRINIVIVSMERERNNG